MYYCNEAEWRSYVEACIAQKKVDDLTNVDLIKEAELVKTDALPKAEMIKAEMIKADMIKTELTKEARILKKAELRAELKSELAAELLQEAELKAELLKAELRAELKAELKSELAAELLQEAELKAELLKAELKAELEAELKAELLRDAELRNNDTNDITTVPKQDKPPFDINPFSPSPLGKFSTTPRSLLSTPGSIPELTVNPPGFPPGFPELTVEPPWFPLTVDTITIKHVPPDWLCGSSAFLITSV
jgi:hypothetical protein